MDAPNWEMSTHDGLQVSKLLVGTGNNSALPFVSVVLPTIGRPSLRSAIRTLKAFDYPKFELLMILDIERRGSALARNVGLRLAKGDIVHFAEDDCEYSKSNLRSLVRKYSEVRSKDPRSAGVIGSFLPAVWGGVAVMIRISTSSEGVKIIPVLGEGRTDYLATGNALCSKQAIMQCGGFNERYSHIFEDLELSLVLKKNGFTLYNCAQALAVHKNEPRLEASVKVLRRSSYLRAKNAILVHKSWCGNPVVYLLKAAAEDLRKSARNRPTLDFEADVHWKRTAERRPSLDVMAYLLGAIAGLTSGTQRRTIQD